MYGAGEDFLHPIFRSAWEVNGPLTIYGAGTNRLPLVHVTDAASYIAALASCTPEGPQNYFMVADEGVCTQVDVVKAVAEKLGSGEVEHKAREEVLFIKGLDRELLDLQLVTTPLPEAAGWSPQYSTGFVAHVDQVVQQYLDVRNINPIRILLMGPPMSGGSMGRGQSDGDSG